MATSPTFSIGTFTILYDSTQYTVSLIHFLPKRKIIATLDTDTQLLIVDGRYVVLRGEPKKIQLLVNVLRQRGVPIVSITDANTDELDYKIIENRNSTGDTIYIRSRNHIFAATITESRYHYFLKVGGTGFSECVEIFVNKDGENTLAQINAEPECGVDKPLSDGEAIDMTKAALQLCALLLDDNEFEFIDNSSIECAPSKRNGPPPRSHIRPFSLAHLYFMTKGQTWYDVHFGAKLKSAEHQEKYSKGASILQQKPDMSFDKLAPKMRLTDDKLNDLRPYFEAAGSWMEFFNSIPKARRCDLLTWAPAFVDRLVDFEICRWPWIINVGEMEKTELFLMPYAPPQRGGRRRGTSKRSRKSNRKTLKQFLYITRLSSRRRGMQVM